MKLPARIIGLSAGFGLVDWEGDAATYSSVTGTGDFIALCGAGLAECGALLPGDAQYTFLPEEGSGSVQFYPGIPVVPQGGGAPVGLPMGIYRMEVVQYGFVGEDFA